VAKKLSDEVLVWLSVRCKIEHDPEDAIATTSSRASLKPECF